MTHLDLGNLDVLDTCGTGGDGAGTFNISTAAALVVAGAGVPVVKHGNRAMSGRSGSADVLAALGLAAESPALATNDCLKKSGMTFCLAAVFHPAMKRVAKLRRRLGVRTLFNCLGPLANPAGASCQLLGVGQPDWLDRMAAALARLGTRHSILVCGDGGLDEVSLCGPTQVREVRDGKISAFTWTPADFRLEPCRLDELRAESPDDSARIIRDILDGHDGPATRIVVANAAVALIAADHVVNPREGVARAAEAIKSGKAKSVLAKLVEISSHARTAEA